MPHSSLVITYRAVLLSSKDIVAMVHAAGTAVGLPEVHGQGVVGQLQGVHLFLGCLHLHECQLSYCCT